MTKRLNNIDFDHHKVGSILACLPKHIREPLIIHLQHQDPNIGHLALRFEDLIHADHKGLTILLQQTDQTALAYAMVTASAPLKQRFYAILGANQSQQLNLQIAQITDTKSPQKPQSKKTYNQQHHLYDELSSNSQTSAAEQDNIELDSKDAQLSIISLAARLRQQQKLILDPPDITTNPIDDKLLNDINKQMQQACESAMAQVLCNYSPEEAAAVLCHRLDRQFILSQMLDQEELSSLESLNLEEMEQLLQSLIGLTKEGD